MMAASASLSEISKILECAVCLDTVANPKTLSCNHSYCKRCLDGLLEFYPDGSARIRCPKTCSGSTFLSDDHTTNDLGVDYMLKNILDVVAANNKQQKEEEQQQGHKQQKEEEQQSHKRESTCSGMNCKRDVTLYCTICDVFFCQHCSSKHDSNHQANSLLTVNTHPQHLEVVCKKHHTGTTYMCCNKFICVYCLNRDHLQHPYNTLDNETRKLKKLLSEEIEKMKRFTANFNVTLHRTENDVRAATNDLDNLLKNRKLQCLSSYIEYLNSEEQRIKAEFNLLAKDHFEELKVINPTWYYEENLSKEGINVVLRKERIINKMNEFGNRYKSITEIRVSLSDHCFSSHYPLGNINIKPCKVSIDKLKNTFQSEFSTGEVDETHAELLHNLQEVLHQSIGHDNMATFWQGWHGNASTTQGVSSCGVIRKLENEDGGIGICRTSVADDARKQSTMADNICDPYVEIANENKVLNECIKQFEERGASYIEELIKDKNNNKFMLLLNEKPDIINVTDGGFGNRPIHMSAKYNNIELMKALIEYNKTVIDMKDDIGNNVLHMASCTPSSKCCGWLLQRYPHLVNKQNNGGCTALHGATVNGNIKTVDLLLDCGADILIKSKDCENAIDCAKMSGLTDILNKFTDMLREGRHVDNGKYADCVTVEECWKKIDGNYCH